VEVDVPTDKLSWIIGTGGKKRMQLEAEYDVTIYVPQINRAVKGTEKVKVTGKPEQNEKAKKAILVRLLYCITNDRTLSKVATALLSRFQKDCITGSPMTDGRKINSVNGSKSTYPMTALNYQKQLRTAT